MENNRIIIATVKSWNINNALKLKEKYGKKYKILLINKKEDLNYTKVKKSDPRFIFFPHWSWVIPDDIYKNYECIVFHMTDLPYGRGGSPLQNLILKKIYNTKITAIKVDKEIDAGKIYLKENFCIKTGSAEEVFMNASEIIFNKMIPAILENAPEPYDQIGEPVYFKRRNPDESDMNQLNFESLEDIYDFIRMLDAEDYPKAFLKIGKFKISFSDVHKKSNKLIGRFDISGEE